jgi:5S rRNA maturation endonuclease (ribonuclease M5)
VVWRGSAARAFGLGRCLPNTTTTLTADAKHTIRRTTDVIRDPAGGSPLELLLSRLEARRNGSGWQACCPAHDDRTPSLSIAEGDNGCVLLRCHAGCTTEAIVSELGLTMSDLFAENGSSQREIVDTYDYLDEAGALLFQAVRFTPKDFRQRRPTGAGGWTWSLGDTRRVLYRLPKVVEAVKVGKPVYVVEGEKDVAALERAGAVATCNPMGAGKWRDEYAEALRGARVIVVADRDEPGREHAAQVARSVQQTAADVKVVEPAEGNDVSDHLAAGRRLDELAEGMASPERQEVTDLTVEKILEAAGVEDLGEDPTMDEVLKALTRGAPKVADRVVELVKEAGVDLFHDENRIAYATFPVDEHVETHPVQSKEFGLFMRGLYYEAEESALSANARSDAIGLLEALSVFKGEELPVYLRVARDKGAIYIDLGDKEWRAIRITAERWEVLAMHPVRFRRTGGMTALPVPTRGGSLDELANLLNLSEDADTDRCLLFGWLLCAGRPGVPYAVLELVGEEGTAKSTATRAVRAMIDPSTTPLRSCPTKLDDLFVSANASWVSAFDNVSGIQPWLSDAICRLATGGGESKRELYTNEGEHLIDVRRPVVMNGIEEIATKGDLLRRTLRVELPVIPEHERLTEAEFWAAFDAMHPRLLGALCDALSCALRRIDEIDLPRKPSMADMAEWVTAAEPALGWEHGAFLNAYDGRRATAHEAVIEAEFIGPYLRQIADVGFEGTASDLLAELAEYVEDGNARKSKEYPKTPRKLTGIIKRLAPALRKLGYTVEQGRHTERGTPWILGRRS